MFQSKELDSASVAKSALGELWQLLDLEPNALQRLKFGSETPQLSSSYPISAMAQASIGASVLMADEIALRRSRQYQGAEILVPMGAVEAECSAVFTLDGRQPESWAKYSGVYRCRDGYIRVHANFDHHRDAFLRLLSCEPGDHVSLEKIHKALLQYSAYDLEEKAPSAGAIIARMRSPGEWAEHPQAKAMSGLAVLELEKIAHSAPIELPPQRSCARPLAGLKVLDITRILAGPVSTRALAAYGAKVLTVNGPGLPNIDHLTDTGRGKRSCLIDLQANTDRQVLRTLVGDSDVFVQSYRPGSLQQRGFGAQELCDYKPGLIYAELSAFGHLGPWSSRRGFDSIVQTACGFNWAEASAFSNASISSASSTTPSVVTSSIPSPKPFPIQVLDFTTGFLMAFGCQVALLRRAQEGGSWRVRCSLLQTANWLNSLGQYSWPALNPEPDFSRYLESFSCDNGELHAMPHAPRPRGFHCNFEQASVTPGTHSACWW